MTEDPLVAALYAAYNAHDAAAAAALYAPDGRHDEIAMGQSRSGQTALAEGLAGFFRMLPDVTWEPEAPIRSADWRAVRYRMRGTFTPRPRPEAPCPAPRTVVIEGMHLLLIRDGAIRISQDYWDKDVFLAQIG